MKMRKIKSSYGNKLVIPKIQVRRSSSVTFPVIQVEDETKLSLAHSSQSSSLSSMNLASGPSLATSYSAASIQRSMNSYRCCCGMFRLRVGTCIIGIVSIGLSIFAMCMILTLSGGLSREMQTSMTLPLSALVLYQTATAMLLIIGVLIDSHSLLMPFLVNCALHVLVSIGGTTVLLISSKEIRRHTPVVVIAAAILMMIYVWFASVIGLTFVLIKDKKSRGLYEEAAADVRAIDRATSSFL